jgi:hypothetical protein
VNTTEAPMGDQNNTNEEVITTVEVMDLIDTIDEYINLVRPYRKNQARLDEALELTKQIKWRVYFDFKFRLEIYHELRSIFENLYLEVNGEKVS